MGLITKPMANTAQPMANTIQPMIKAAHPFFLITKLMGKTIQPMGSLAWPRNHTIQPTRNTIKPTGHITQPTGPLPTMEVGLWHPIPHFPDIKAIMSQKDMYIFNMLWLLVHASEAFPIEISLPIWQTT